MKLKSAHKLICLLLTAILSVCMLSGCTGKEDNKDGFEVVTSFYPMYVFTKNITEGAKNVTVKNMAPADTGCLHDYQLMPRDLKNLESADLLIINGAGMEKFLDKIIESSNELKILDTSDNENTKLLDTGGEENPHIWLYVRNAIRQIDAITDALCLYDPVNPSVYLSNRSNYVHSLNELDREFSEASMEFSNKKIITTHSSFDYMAHWYGLEIVGTVFSDHNSEPSTAELSKLVDAAKNNNVAAIFKEPDYPETAVNTISRETGIPVYTLDPMVTGKDGEYKGVYESVMRKNLNVLKEALR